MSLPSTVRLAVAAGIAVMALGAPAASAGPETSCHLEYGPKLTQVGPVSVYSVRLVC